MDPDEIQSRQQLAGALTQLRESAGLSLRRLATAVGAPLATLGGYFSGQHLPTAAQSALFRRVLEACGVTEPEQLESWLRAVARIRRQPARRSTSQPAPYRGLESFQPEDAPWFFGREALTDVLVDHARTGGIVAVVGASGSGKSSLLRAGLVATLRASAGKPWTCLVMTPAQDPIGELKRVLVGILPPGDHDSGDLAGLVAAAAENPLLLVIDQFEELFSGQSTDSATRLRFVQVLHAIATQRGQRQRTAIVLGLRADFYSDASRDPLLLPVLQTRQLLVGALSRTALRTVIEQPARQAGVEVDPDLVEVLVRELAPRGSAGSAHDEGALPLLSHALRQTWLRSGGGRLTLADFEAAGGITGAVQQTAEEAFGELDDDSRALAKRLFLRLVNVEADAAVTRRRVSRDLLLSADPDRAAVEDRVLDSFVGHRLITTDEVSVQLSHEAILTAWPRLAEWIELDRVGLQRHRELRAWAAAWRDRGMDESELLRGGRLAATLEWARGADSVAELDALETDYLDASALAAEDASQAERLRARRLRQLVAVAVVLAVLACGAALFGLSSRSAALTDRAAATDARDRALSRQLAGSSAGLRASDPALAAQLALLAFRTSPTLEARSALLDASSVPTPTRLIGPAGATLTLLAPSGLLMAVSSATDGSITLWSLSDPAVPVRQGSMPDPVAEQQFAGAFSPDGTMFVSGGSAGSVVLWDVRDPENPVRLGEPLRLPDAAAGVRAVAFARGGRELLAEGRPRDGSGPYVSRWDIADPAQPKPLGELAAAGEVLALVTNPAGTLLAVGGGGGVELWSLDGDGSAQQQSILHPNRDRTLALAFSGDGSTLTTGTADASLQFWNVSNPAQPAEVIVGPRMLGAQINGLTYSPDGSILGAAASDATVTFWDTETWAPLGSLPHTGPATSVAFTPDQRTVVTASTDGVARTWPFPGPTLGGIGGVVLNLFFSASAELSVGANDDRMRIWNVADRLHPAKSVADIAGATGPGKFTGAAAISPDGRLAAGGTGAGPIGLWQLASKDRSTADPGYVATLPELTASVSFLAFSPDSNYLIATGRSNTVDVWDVRNPGSPQHLSSSPLVDQGYFADFSPDSRLFAAADVKGHVTLWDFTQPTAPQKLADLTGVGVSAYTVAFSPNGRYLAAGGISKAVQLWDIANPAAPVPVGPPVTGPRSEIYWIAFSPDSAQLAAASTDGTVSLWDLTGPVPAATAELTLASGTAYSAAFAPGGSTLAAAGSGQVVQLWTTDPAEVAAQICATQGVGITESEWQLYLAEQPYAPPCG